MSEKIKSNLTDEIRLILKDYGIKDILIEFSSISEFSINLPYIIGKNVSTGFNPELFNTLREKGFSMYWQYANNANGIMLCGKVTKQV